MEKLRKLLMKNSTFPILTALLGACVIGGAHMFITEGFGLLNGTAQAVMLQNAIATGDYSLPLGYTSGYLFARVLEGPLVGILDIGGSMQTGVGVGITALFLSLNMGWLIESFPLALLTGLAVGAAVGLVIIGVRKTMPEGMAASGTDIMIGAGNATGRYFGPLIFLSAIGYSIPAGLGAIIGGAICYKLDKPVVGGAIIGAMLLAVIFPVVA